MNKVVLTLTLTSYQFLLKLILHLVQNHLGGLSKIVLHGNKVKKSTVDAIKVYLRENHMDTESETTRSDLDVTFSSMTSETTSTTGSSSKQVRSEMAGRQWRSGSASDCNAKGSGFAARFRDKNFRVRMRRSNYLGLVTLTSFG
jgi:hypothetical protein